MKPKLRHRLLLLMILAAFVPLSGHAADTILYNFSANNGRPAGYGSLTLGNNVLYGMTGNGGTESLGSIFQVNTDGSGFTVLHSFTSDGVSDGASPLSSLTLVGNVLYGMTLFGGIVPPVGPPANSGAVFCINIDGTGFQILHGFTGNASVGSNDGCLPYGAVTVSGSTIYGMTQSGGAAAQGTIFSMSTDGSGFQLLHSFTGVPDDGANPEGSLTLAGSILYGVTNGGGINGEGTIFSINTDGTGFTVLYNFGTSDSGDAGQPIGGNGLTLVGSTLFGLTYYGGASQNGALFSINTDGTGYQIVHSFSLLDGSAPFGSLTLSGSQLYGTTSGQSPGVVSFTGSLFSQSVDGRAFTVLQTFGGGPADGQTGIGNPVMSADGAIFYGMTENGGSNSGGAIFSSPASGSSTNANLLSLVPSAGALDIPFDSETPRYTVIVADSVASMTVTPMAEDAGATVTINGVAAISGAPSPPICLSTGSNVLNILVTARDGMTTNLYTLNVIRLTPLQNWRSNFLGTSANAGNAADNADFDSNGISNLAKYAFGLDPTSPASNQIPQPVFSAGNLGVSFAQPSGINGIVYGAEWTQSLNPPAWTPLPDAGSGSMHNFQAFVGSLPSAFMRLKVTVPLSPIEQLGKDIFFDSTLSNPPGLSCAGCHSPSAGFTGPTSAINLAAGPVPGAVAGRSGFRKPQAVAYSTFSPSGPYFDPVQGFWTGGNFWDGRAPTNAGQALMPFIGPNEMANVPVGPYPPHAGGYSPDVVQKISQETYAALFQQVFGAGVFQAGHEAAAYTNATQAIAAYEASAEVVPFSSKYDASVNAVPPSNAYTFTASEENGRQLFFGKALCSACHSSSALDSVSSVTNGREVFTMYCFANIGVPANPNNPYYQETDPTNNPYGYNPLGTAFIDYGLGANPNPAPGGAVFFSNTPGDNATFRGLFKAPSLRNVDLRPSPDFVKSYMHNGVFKSLAEVVHFYNKRNIAVDATGNEVSFDLRLGPPPGYTPLFPPPEVMDNVQNVVGFAPADVRIGEADVPTDGQVGNLQLSPQEECDLVNFLRTLTDGFTGSSP